MKTAEPAVIAELHVDDIALEGGASWTDAMRLVLCIGELTSAAGARLSFRFRHRFAEEAARRGADNPLARLEAAGHEVGTHAHGRGLPRAQRAVSACGVANRGVTPGMVQAGSRIGRVWKELSQLGFAWVTDHPPQRAWAYAGHLPWRPGPGFRPDVPAEGPVMLDTAADPFAWGLLERRAGGVEHRCVGPEAFELLEGLLARHRCPLPAGSRPFFAFALHEHNLCDPGSLTPSQPALDALAAFLARHRVISAGEVAATLPPVPGLLPAQPPPPALRVARKLRIASRPLRQRVGGRPRGEPGPFTVKRGAQRLHAHWFGPAEPRGLLLLSHAGLQGGTHTLLRPFGLDHARIVAAGIAVVAYDRTGTGRSPADVSLTPGGEHHVRDFRAVIRAVRARLPAGVPLGVMSFSSGVLPPLRAGEPFAFLIDGEAPADRWSLRPPAGTGAPRDEGLAGLTLEDDEAWEGREPARLLSGLACPYHRIQAELDHVHGRLWAHAQLMIEAARGAGLPTRANGGSELRLLPGRLHAHGRLVERWVLEGFEGAGAT
jgi:hypothetical protein